MAMHYFMRGFLCRGAEEEAFRRDFFHAEYESAGTPALHGTRKRGKMANLARFPLSTGGSVVVEMDDAASAPQKTMRGGVAADAIAKASQTFDEALDGVRSASEAMLAQLASLAQPPDELAIEFGIKLNAETGAVIAKAAAEANFTVSLKWKRGTAGKE